MMTVAQLGDAIDVAFAATESPGRTNLVSGHLDRSGQVRWDEDDQEVVRLLDGVDWRELTAAHVTYREDLSSLLSDAAFAYYLPGYLKLMLEDIEGLGVVAPWILSRLSAPPPGRDRRRLDALTGRLDVRQRGLVAIVLLRLMCTCSFTGAVELVEVRDALCEWAGFLPPV